MGDVWIGRTDVSKGEGCLLDFDGGGAFVSCATQANSEETFLRKLDEVVKYYKVVLLEVSDIRRYDEADDVSEDIHEIAERVMENEKWFLFGEFYTYSRHDA